MEDGGEERVRGVAESGGRSVGREKRERLLWSGRSVRLIGAQDRGTYLEVSVQAFG